jgi:hypothetical protein
MFRLSSGGHARTRTTLSSAIGAKLPAAPNGLSLERECPTAIGRVSPFEQRRLLPNSDGKEVTTLLSKHVFVPVGFLVIKTALEKPLPGEMFQAAGIFDASQPAQLLQLITRKRWFHWRSVHIHRIGNGC